MIGRLTRLWRAQGAAPPSVLAAQTAPTPPTPDALPVLGAPELLAAHADLLRTIRERSGLAAIARGAYAPKAERKIRGSGYVAESLEAAMWCFLRTDSFESAVLAAVNLGDDADTTAAVCGQVAGAHFGASGIPARWLDRLAMREEIEKLADRLRRGAAAERR